jgi:hypothetical protein
MIGSLPVDAKVVKPLQLTSMLIEFVLDPTVTGETVFGTLNIN